MKHGFKEYSYFFSLLLTKSIPLIKKRSGDTIQEVFFWEEVDSSTLAVEELSIETVIEVVVGDELFEGMGGLQGSGIPDKFTIIELKSVELNCVSIPESTKEVNHKFAVLTAARSTLPLSSSPMAFHINSSQSDPLIPSGAISLSTAKISETSARLDSIEKMV